METTYTVGFFLLGCMIGIFAGSIPFILKNINKNLEGIKEELSSINEHLAEINEGGLSLKGDETEE